jgi:hypothetical protein
MCELSAWGQLAKGREILGILFLQKIYTSRENKRWKGVYNDIYILFLNATRKSIKSK